MNQCLIQCSNERRSNFVIRSPLSGWNDVFRVRRVAYAHVDPDGDGQTEWPRAYEPFGAGEITITPGSKSGKNKDDPETIAAKQAAIEKRKEVDELIFANLLRLNQQRAADGQ